MVRAAIAFEAAWIALMPFSGSMPAWAALPWTATSIAKYDGPPMMIVSSVSLSSRNPRLAVMRLKSSCFTPRRPTSSWREIAISTGGRTGATRSASIISAMPALSSAPRIVSPPDRMTPSFRTGVMPTPGRTVSPWQESSTGLAPLLSAGSRAMRLP